VSWALAGVPSAASIAIATRYFLTELSLPQLPKIRALQPFADAVVHLNDQSSLYHSRSGMGAGEEQPVRSGTPRADDRVRYRLSVADWRSKFPLQLGPTLGEIESICSWPQRPSVSQQNPVLMSARRQGIE
jgi:hypothetical protein